MGHRVNPLILRLGISKNWSYNLKESKNWITNFLVYQLVSNQFLNYTLPFFNRKKNRNTRNSQGLVKMRGEKQIVKNQLIKRSILFSHMNLGSKNSEFFVNCCFYDHGVHYKRYQLREKKLVRYNQLFSNSPIKRYRRHPYWRKQIKHRNYPWMFKKWISKLGPQLWLYNHRIRNFWARANGEINFTLFLSWLRLVKKLKKFNTAKKVFFINVWINLLSAISLVLLDLGSGRAIRKRIYLMIHLLNFVNYSLKIRSFDFFSHLFLHRFFIFKAMSRTLNSSLRSLLTNLEKVNITFHALKEKQMRSSLIVNLMLVKLGQYYTINSILYPVANWLKKNKNVEGFRIIVSGRLTRRERASHIIKSYEMMPLSSYKYKIDYHQDIKIMKFGMVGLKVYLILNEKRKRTNYYWIKFSHKQ